MNLNQTKVFSSDVGIVSSTVARGNSGDFFEHLSAKPVLSLVFIDRRTNCICPVSEFFSGNKNFIKAKRTAELYQNSNGEDYLFESWHIGSKTIFPIFDIETEDCFSYLKDYLSPSLESFARKEFSKLEKGLSLEEFENISNAFVAKQMNELIWGESLSLSHASEENLER